MTYIVMEIQTNTNGTVGTLVNAYTDRNLAEQQYHTVLASAAVSSLPAHAAVLLTWDGRLIESHCYRHQVENPEE